MRKLTTEQRYEVVSYRDRMLYAAVAEGFDSKSAAEMADAAAQRKAKEMAAKAA